MKKIFGVAASVAAAIMLVHARTAEAMDIGTMAEVRQNVYGVPPEGGHEAVKHKGDSVVFKETLQTLDESGALVRFVDNSKLSLGAKSKVVIDEFVFDPKNANGNALIKISVGTLRWVTGDMPKGGTVIKTPTATLVLRGTDVVVHVHPDGTTDTIVYDGKVEAHNNVTNQVTDMVPGDGATLGHYGTTSLEHDEGPDLGAGDRDHENDSPPEHRRADPAKTDARGAPEPNADADTGGDDSGDDGCGCI